MAIESIVEQKPSGSVDENGYRYYTRRWVVKVDDKADGPIVAGTHVDFPVLRQSTYVSGNDSDPWAICVGAKEDPVPDSLYHWIITADYSSKPLNPNNEAGALATIDPTTGELGGASSPAQSGAGTAPEFRPWTLSKTSRQTTRLLGPTDLEGTSVCNSAGQPFTDIEIPCSVPVYTITGMTLIPVATLIGKANLYEDAINSDTWLFFGPQQARCTSYTLESTYERSGPLTKFSIEVEYKEDGWNPVVVYDMGTAEKDSGGSGLPLKAITDSTGNQISTPVPLNGSGYKLAPGSPLVPIEYKGYREVSFAGIFPLGA